MHDHSLVISNVEDILSREVQVIVIIATHHMDRTVDERTDIIITTLYVATVNQHINMSNLADHTRHIIITSMRITDY